LRPLQYCLLVAAGLLFGVLSSPLLCAAQQELHSGVSDYVPSGEPEPSRDEWRQRIEEARRRAREVARERSLHPDDYALVPEDAEAVASERVLSDETLQRGDIVRTKKGMFVFQGRSDQQRNAQDFAPFVPK
jgi:hypothetical protein